MRGVGPVPGGQDNRTVHLSTREGYDLSELSNPVNAMLLILKVHNNVFWTDKTELKDSHDASLSMFLKYLDC